MPQPTQRAAAPDFIPADQPDFIPAQAAPDKPNSFWGGAGRRLKDLIGQPPQTIGEGLRTAPWLGPITQPLISLIRSERQLGPQFVDQLKQADASHAGESPLRRAALPISNLLDARTATTGLSMANPFAAGSVANVNQLSDEGRLGEAAGQGTVDAALLTAGLAAPKVLPAARSGMRALGRTMETNAPKVAEFAAHPVASTVRPIVRGGIRTSGRLLQRMGGPEPPPPTETAAPTQSFSPQPLTAEQADVPPTPERGTWSADPRTQEQILESMQNLRGGGQGKVAMQQGAEAPPAAPVPRSSRPGFGTATVPIEERMDMSGLYGKTSGRSNLAANQRQLASPTGSTAPVPPQPLRFVPKADMTPEDYAFQDENMEDILGASIGQRRLIDQINQR